METNKWKCNELTTNVSCQCLNATISFIYTMEEKVSDCLYVCLSICFVSIMSNVAYVILRAQPPVTFPVRRLY